MNKKYKSILGTLLFSFFFLPSISHAEVEDWYAYWSLGLANHDHPGSLNDLFDSAESAPGVDRTEISLDMLGFYWPLKNNDVAGFIINGSSDNLSDNSGNSLSLNTYLYGVSYMKFMGNEPGDGFFVRGDFGIAKAVVTVSDGFSTDSSSSDSGTGYLLGIGMGVPLSPRARLMFGLNTTNKSIESETFKSTQFTIGLLW